jgi:FKBP-type peptidyl-prolyl cis-trans isomerase 2
MRRSTCRLEAVYTVTEVYPSHVVLDGNHPAGMALRLHLTVRGFVKDGSRDRSRQRRRQCRCPGSAPAAREVH